MLLKDYFKKGKFYVWEEKFAIVKAKKPLANAFAIIKDKNEITCIINQSKIKNKKNIIKIDKGWKIIIFDVVLPFGLVGFLAKISKTLASEGIGIFVVSSYSTDHILIKKNNIKKAVNKLKSLGLRQMNSF
ncbi:ACT domain-containing protein [Candidatus Woesearchaeota archaeon]|nr:ACT domain-containing protein [Candidatus Woesearchaeota archaeon]